MDPRQIGLLVGLCICAAFIIILSVVACWKAVERRPRPADKTADAERALYPPVKRVRFASTVQVH